MKHAHLFVAFATSLLLAGCGWKSFVSTKKLDVNPSMKDGDIRQKLLSLTPKGSDGTNVLKFVVDDLRPTSGCSSYFAYYDALKAAGYTRLNVVPVNLAPPAVPPTPPDWPPREIYVVLGTYPESHFIWSLTACWKFDKHDKLTDIVICRDNSP
jgi:hypothetical protein